MSDEEDLDFDFSGATAPAAAQPRRGPFPARPRTLLAQFDSNCPACGREIIEGDPITLSQSLGSYRHVNCDDSELLAREDDVGTGPFSNERHCSLCQLMHAGECF